MKLKKIAALALAGVMAVSMLAGCAGKTNTDKNDTTADVTVPAAGVSAQVKLTNEDVKLADNATYTAWLSKAISDAKLTSSDVVDAAKDGKGAWHVVAAADEVKDVLTALQNQFKYNVRYYGASSNEVSNLTETTSKSNYTNAVYMSLYVIDGTNFTQAEALTALGKELDKTTAKFTTPIHNASNYYDHTYTGSVSMQKVTSGDATVWFALVSLTDNVTKR